MSKSISLLSNFSKFIKNLSVSAWNIAPISGVLLLILISWIGLNQRLFAWLVMHLSLLLLTPFPYIYRAYIYYLSFFCECENERKFLSSCSVSNFFPVAVGGAVGVRVKKVGTTSKGRTTNPFEVFIARVSSRSGCTTTTIILRSFFFNSYMNT